ncbi:hypothetical protein CRYUN_Cryun40dG0053300 [Craigia yunnanensis]
MEAFDMAACLEDNLLDFGSDVGEEDEEHKKKSSKINSSSLNPNRSFPEFAEEELEWLSNKDLFPAVETSFFDILGIAAKHQSPVSVLDNSSSNSSGSATLTNGNIIMYCCSNVKVPVKARSKRLRKCRDLRNQKNSWWVQENVKNVNTTAKGAGSRTIGRKCQHCGAAKTPQWRAGPLGPKTLCNACGVRYKSGRLVPEYRPASSPTFSSELHSNSHRKILEMKRHKLLGFSAMKPMDKGGRVAIGELASKAVTQSRFSVYFHERTKCTKSIVNCNLMAPITELLSLVSSLYVFFMCRRDGNEVIEQSYRTTNVSKRCVTVAKGIEFKEKVKNVCAAGLVKHVKDATYDVA